MRWLKYRKVRGFCVLGSPPQSTIPLCFEPAPMQSRVARGRWGRRVGWRGSLRSRPRAPACARARHTCAAPTCPGRRGTEPMRGPEKSDSPPKTTPSVPPGSSTICSRCRNAVNLLPCASLPIPYRRSGKRAVRTTFRALHASINLPLAAPQACVAKASISTSSVPQGRLRCVPDERVPGRQGVRVARLRESQSARSCCRCRSGFS